MSDVTFLVRAIGRVPQGMTETQRPTVTHAFVSFNHAYTMGPSGPQTVTESQQLTAAYAFVSVTNVTNVNVQTVSESQKLTANYAFVSVNYS